MIDRSGEGGAELPSAALRRLQRALDERGIAARVEERAALAIIVPRGVPDSSDGEARDGEARDGTVSASASASTSATDDVPASPRDGGALAASLPALRLDADLRQWLVQAALAAGFSHVALEVVPPGQSHAALPGRHPA